MNARFKTAFASFRRHAPWVLALAGFVASRVFYTRLGIRLDDEPLAYFWQYLDTEELRDNLLQSLFYQHIQPPLYNLYLGIGLKTGDPLLFYRATALAFGLALHLGLYRLARRLSIRAWLASAAAITFAFHPASILMETWLFYTYPVAAMLVVSAVLLHRGLEAKRGGALFLAFTCMALVVATRSLFHAVWMVAAIALVVLFARRRWRVIAIAIVPLLLAGSVYVKNWVVFGRPVASSWMGFSLSRLTTTKLSDLERDAWMDEGALSDLAAHPPWLPLSHYPRSYRAVPEGLPDIPVLTAERRRNGHLNFNHAAYLAIGDRYAQDARVVLERAPELWWDSTKHAWTLHFLPIHDYTFFHARRRAAGPWMRRIESGYEWIAGSGFAGWTWDEPMPAFEERPGWVWAGLMGVALIVALVVAVRRRRARPTAITLVYCVMTIVFVAVIGNSLEVGENQRFRFLSEPLTWVLMTLTIDRTLSALMRLRMRLQIRKG